MIILASSSPRRTELLALSGIPHRVVASPAPEISEGAPDEIVLINALNKAKATAARLQSDESLKEYARLPVLGADTLVAMDGNIFGKPADRAEAIKMLTALSNRTHTVYTGICLLVDGQPYRALDATQVTFVKLGDSAIARYLKSGEYRDKAGAYAVQGRAMTFISSLRGSAANVIGLPVHRLAELAERAGIDLYGD